jgi:hypothetical protein
MRHPYTTNAARLASAQAMHDRATDDRTDFSDWYESDHYALWLSDMTDALVAGCACFGYDAEAIIDRLRDCDASQWGAISDVEKEAVEAWGEYCDAVTVNALATTRLRRTLADIKKEAMQAPIRELAKQMAEEKAVAYYWQEVAK